MKLAEGIVLHNSKHVRHKKAETLPGLWEQKRQSCQFFFPVKMSRCCWIALVALIPLTLGTNPGVKVQITPKGLEYGTNVSYVKYL